MVLAGIVSERTTKFGVAGRRNACPAIGYGLLGGHRRSLRRQLPGSTEAQAEPSALAAASNISKVKNGRSGRI
jgi:hypothetical protein